MNLGLEGKRALVSGSSSGIGVAIARMLAEHGATVIVHGRNQARAEGVVAAILDAGGHALAVLGDLCSDEDVAAIAREVDHQIGGVDILVNNAGDAQPFSPDWFAVSAEQWLTNYDRNVVSAVRLTNQFVPGMKERGWGRVIMIGSNAYIDPPVDFPTYAPSKAALVNLMLSYAKLLSNTGVTANMISPGSVRTEAMLQNFLGLAQSLGWSETDPVEIEKRLVAEKWPNYVGRLGTPEEIAAMVTLVASDVSGFTTGANIRVEGGYAASFH